MAADPPFEVFGDKARFALEIRQTPAAVIGTEPEDSAGSWGEWRLWIANLNLCELRLDTQNGLTQVHEVRWFLAPFFAWIVENWMPLLHEKRLPPGGRLGDSRPRSARAAYLAMVESAGDDFERFRPWQCWANRHSLRSASHGGILPDVFVQRMDDDLEFSWGDRVQPGADAASFGCRGRDGKGFRGRSCRVPAASGAVVPSTTTIERSAMGACPASALGGDTSQACRACRFVLVSRFQPRAESV